MTLRDLLLVLEQPGMSPVTVPAQRAGILDEVVSGLAYDSRRVVAGNVFVALMGERADGSTFAPEAIAKGAIAVVSDRVAPAQAPVPWTHVADGRLALSVLASWFYGDPSHELQVVGITGTNGKTTTSYLIRAMLERAGLPCGLVGTVQYSVGADLFDAPRTTPEALDLQQLFRRMVTAGARACSVEVSSHALSLKRVEATRFAAAVFTNLTRDHLDFHGDMDRYFEAKRHLFDLLPAGAPAIINADDASGARFAAGLGRVLTYGVHQAADVRPEEVEPSLGGVSFRAVTPAGRLQIRSRLAGQFNLYNLLAAVATGVALDLPADAIVAGLADLTAVPGRLQVVSGPDDDVTVIVDYAHTDDALRNILEAVRPLVTGRLTTVFGCGGDRDRTKRPLMGAVAARLSDRVVVTSDNPRSEDPERIIDDVASGMATRDGAGTSGHWSRNADRRAAINDAITEAGPRDVVVVAGKGHEQYQVVGSRTLPFDDVTVSREALAQRRQAHAGGAR
jgi:UDP-N-acetylmuramoyl-L-alanyl-D-glutamate--2,6-diaminopimelate ligase